MNSALKGISKVKEMWGAPPKLAVSEWADTERRLSPESSAEPGQFDTGRAEYQRGIMDALSDSKVEEIVFMKSAQVGATEMLGNIIGYFIDQDPSPILLVQPTIEMGQTWSKDRFAPMLRDTPCLSGKVRDVRSRDSGNTILRKSFPGGSLNISGANSAASLASRPVRVVLCDEVDRYPVSAGTEGDPVSLAKKRANNFWNRKIILTSTPTVKDASRIESAYEASDKRKYYVPCPKCGVMDILSWSQVVWPKGEPEKALYQCIHCGAKLGHADKLTMIKHGEWRAERPCTGTAGFWLNELYSPWVSFDQMAVNFIEAKKSPDTLRVFVNTSLGETWDEQGGEKVEAEGIMARREVYEAQVPDGALVLVAGVDTQDDRLEIEVVAYGAGSETWGIEYAVIHGSPAREEVWKDLDQFLEKTYVTEGGVRLRVACTCIDSGGHHTKRVYDYVKPRQIRRVYATKGSSQPGKPLVGRFSTSNLGKVKLFPVGTDTAKDLIYGRLMIEEFGPGYMHFPDAEALCEKSGAKGVETPRLQYDEEYFKQLTAEKKITKFVKGVSSQKWIKTRARNEVLDIRVLAEVAFAIFNPNLEAFEKELNYQAANIKAGGPELPRRNPHQRRIISRGIE